MAGTKDPSNRPLIVAIAITAAILVATSFLPVTSLLSRYLREIVIAIQIFAGVVYVLIIGKYSIDSGLIRDYNPQMSLARFTTSLLGPIFGLGTELLSVIAYSQLANLLLRGITFREWNHQLPTNGPNFWLLTLVAIFFLIIAVLNLLSRANDVRYYWSDLTEIEA
jgi:predicted lysophospholipase L1 biosynthesis ABC-type transport system permease subunit